jgi:ABC-type multidrug transport system ATPase subunit
MCRLKVEHVTKRHGHAAVVDELTFTVAPGPVTCFLGPPGAAGSPGR